MNDVINAIRNAFEIWQNEQISSLVSKVEGRENYIIQTFTENNGALRIVFSGTKGRWLNAVPRTYPLSVAAKMNWYRFTYKKDFIETLRKIEEIIKLNKENGH